jgi:hypothetical protein
MERRRGKVRPFLLVLAPIDLKANAADPGRARGIRLPETHGTPGRRAVAKGGLLWTSCHLQIGSRSGGTHLFIEPKVKGPSRWSG